ncbi:MAG: ATP-binding protein [Kistimonas sp.]|nr:ATP-binding protein [Kistimonas sp.]
MVSEAGGADHGQQRLTLGIDSRLSDTVLVAMAVRGLCTMTSLTAEDINRVELCVVEAVNNAIEHAYGGKSGFPVTVELVLCPQRSLEIGVVDCGEAMSWPPSAKPQATEDMGVWLTSGRGLSIVSRLMDEVRYESDQGRNTLYMVRRLGS